MPESTNDRPPRLVPVNPPTAAYPGLSQAMIVRQGDIMFLTGHVSVGEDGAIIDGDFETQLDAAFRNIGRTLAAGGADFSGAVKFTYYVVGYQPEMLAALKRVRNRYISQEAPPASTFVAVAALYDPRLRVEIDGIVALSPKGAA
jgi:enamine deaminase RidA (YjgF/YER057c/UK114 family)